MQRDLCHFISYTLKWWCWIYHYMKALKWQTKLAWRWWKTPSAVAGVERALDRCAEQFPGIPCLPHPHGIGKGRRRGDRGGKGGVRGASAGGKTSYPAGSRNWRPKHSARPCEGWIVRVHLTAFRWRFFLLQYFCRQGPLWFIACGFSR